MMKIIVKNSKVFFDYVILEEFIAGLVLYGGEVKSIKAGKVNISGSYIKNFSNELYAIGMHISKHMGVGEETRDVKLLLNRREIDKLSKAVEKKRLTIVPISIVLVKGLVKIKIGLAKGKQKHDKRETLKERAKKRDSEIEIKKFMK